MSYFSSYFLHIFPHIFPHIFIIFSSPRAERARAVNVGGARLFAASEGHPHEDGRNSETSTVEARYMDNTAILLLNF